MSLSILCCLSLSFCAYRPEVTVTSLHPPRLCRIAVLFLLFQYKRTSLSLELTVTSFHPPTLSRFAVFLIQTNIHSHQCILANSPISNRHPNIRQFEGAGPVNNNGRSRPRTWTHTAASLPMPLLSLESYIYAFCSCSVRCGVGVAVTSDSPPPFVSLRGILIGSNVCYRALACCQG